MILALKESYCIPRNDGCVFVKEGGDTQISILLVVFVYCLSLLQYKS